MQQRLKAEDILRTKNIGGKKVNILTDMYDWKLVPFVHLNICSRRIMQKTFLGQKISVGLMVNILTDMYDWKLVPLNLTSIGVALLYSVL